MANATQELPDGLDTAPPGPGLAVALDGIDRTAVSGYDAMTGTLAVVRLENWVKAEKFPSGLR